MFHRSQPWLEIEKNVQSVGTALLPKKLLMNNTKGSDIIWLIRLQHTSMCVLCMVKNLELKKAFPHKVLGIYIIHSDYTQYTCSLTHAYGVNSVCCQEVHWTFKITRVWIKTKTTNTAWKISKPSRLGSDTQQKKISTEIQPWEPKQLMTWWTKKGFHIL